MMAASPPANVANTSQYVVMPFQIKNPLNAARKNVRRDCFNVKKRKSSGHAINWSSGAGKGNGGKLNPNNTPASEAASQGLFQVFAVTLRNGIPL